MKQKTFKRLKQWGVWVVGCLIGVLNPLMTEATDSSNTMLGGPSHIGTFEGGTTFTTSSSNGISPGLYLEVMDESGNYTEYTSEEGVITLPDTQEGAYVTQAKLLGKTKYIDQDTGEILDQWEAGRNLKLESVKRPVLTTTGKNLMKNNDFDLVIPEGVNSNDFPGTVIERNIPVKPNTTYTISFGEYVNVPEIGGALFRSMTFRDLFKSVDETVHVNAYNHENRIKENNTYTFTTENDCKYLVITTGSFISRGDINISNIQLEEGEVSTSYEPYQSNILTVNEEVELRGIGEVQDTLDLLTGEYIQRFGEIVVNGDKAPSLQVNLGTVNRYFHSATTTGALPAYSVNNKGNQISNKYQYASYDFLGDYEHFYIDNGGGLMLFSSKTSEELMADLQANPLVIQYQVATPVIKTVDLNSTYYFKPVNNRKIHVEGSILPLVCSVTTPTDPLSFVINPNAEEGQQFIAPEFTIANQTKASVSIELKRFEQVTQVLNDVLPDQYEDWTILNKKQSKDIALALVPKASEGWESLVEGPRYVADSSNDYIGEIKANSSVDFTFEALHGSAFVESLKPQYELIVVFDF